MPTGIATGRLGGTIHALVSKPNKVLSHSLLTSSPLFVSVYYMRTFLFLLLASCIFVFPACQKNVATNQSQTPSDPSGDSQTAEDVEGEAILASRIASNSLQETPEFTFEESIIVNDEKGQIQLFEYTEELKERKLEESPEKGW